MKQTREERMKLSNFAKSCIKPLLLIIPLSLLALTITGCAEDFGCENFNQWSPTTPTEPTAEVEKPTPSKVITTADRAFLAVHEHLLTLAEGYQAKQYLADFYVSCEDWTAESVLFKDGTSVWYVYIEITNTAMLTEEPYWEEASWLVFEDGKVIPARLSQANALRIEADLQQLSMQPE